MIRFSLVIQNDAGEFLICETEEVSGQKKYEFPGGEFETSELPPFEDFLKSVHDTVLKEVSIDVCDLERLELYFREEPFFLHTIFTARVLSGDFQPIKYHKAHWMPIDKFVAEEFNLYGLQVLQKLNECGYCHFLRQRHDEINNFFNDYFSKAEENLAVLEALDNAEKNNSLYMLAFKQEMIHIRASLIENAKQKRNITIQNYFRLYGRLDLAEKIDQLLQLKVKDNLSLREMIKTTVDKFIAHYDDPSDEDKGIYEYCISLFALDGNLPLTDFIRLIEGYIMSLVTLMWYDAGELGVLISDRRAEDRLAILKYGETSINKIVDALKIMRHSDI